MFIAVMRAATRSLFILAAILAVSPARADIYKWVDAAGVTHYSNQAPPAAVKSASVVAERISVYQPAPALTRAVSAAPRADRQLDDRIEVLERQLQQERLYRQQAASSEALALQAAYEQCLAQRRVDCDEMPFYPGYAPSVIIAARRRAPFMPLRPAMTAGNAVTFSPRGSQSHRLR
jgi:hypothetical protein